MRAGGRAREPRVSRGAEHALAGGATQAGARLGSALPRYSRERRAARFFPHHHHHPHSHPDCASGNARRVLSNSGSLGAEAARPPHVVKVSSCWTWRRTPKGLKSRRGGGARASRERSPPQAELSCCPPAALAETGKDFHWDALGSCRAPLGGEEQRLGGFLALQLPPQQKLYHILRRRGFIPQTAALELWRRDSRGPGTGERGFLSVFQCES